MFTITIKAEISNGASQYLVYEWPCVLCPRHIYRNLDLEYVTRLATSHMINGHNAFDSRLRVEIDLPGRDDTVEEESWIHPSHNMRPMLGEADRRICDNCMACVCHYPKNLIKSCIYSDVAVVPPNSNSR